MIGINNLNSLNCVWVVVGIESSSSTEIPYECARVFVHRCWSCQSVNCYPSWRENPPKQFLFLRWFFPSYPGSKSLSGHRVNFYKGLTLYPHPLAWTTPTRHPVRDSVQVINAGAISDEGFISLPDYRPPQFARLLSWCMNFQIERNGGPREGPVELGSPHHLLPSRSPHTPLSLCRNFYSTYYILSAYLSVHSLDRRIMHTFVCACQHVFTCLTYQPSVSLDKVLAWEPNEADKLQTREQKWVRRKGRKRWWEKEETRGGNHERCCLNASLDSKKGR